MPPPRRPVPLPGYPNLPPDFEPEPTPVPRGLGPGERIRDPALAVDVPPPDAAELERVEGERQWREQLGYGNQGNDLHKPLTPEEQQELEFYRQQRDQNPQGQAFEVGGDVQPAGAAAEPEAPAGDPFTGLQSMLMGGAEGATLGLWDNALSNLAGLTGHDPVFGRDFSGDFDERKRLAAEFYKQMGEQAYTDNPKSYIGGDLAGSFLLPGGAITKGARAAAKGANAAVKAARLAGKGIETAERARRIAVAKSIVAPSALMGGLSGLGASGPDDDALSTGINVAAGAGTQAVLGPVAQRLGLKASDFVRKAVRDYADQKAGAQIIRSLGGLFSDIPKLGGAEKASRTAHTARDLKLWRPIRDAFFPEVQMVRPRVRRMHEESAKTLADMRLQATVPASDLLRKLGPALMAARLQQGTDPARFDLIRGAVRDLTALRRVHGHNIPAKLVNELQGNVGRRIESFAKTEGFDEALAKRLLQQLSDAQENAVESRFGGTALDVYKEAKKHYGVAKDILPLLERSQSEWVQRLHNIGGLQGLIALLGGGAAYESGIDPTKGALTFLLLTRPRAAYALFRNLRHPAAALQHGLGMAGSPRVTRPWTLPLPQHARRAVEGALGGEAEGEGKSEQSPARDLFALPRRALGIPRELPPPPGGPRGSGRPRAR